MLSVSIVCMVLWVIDFNVLYSGAHMKSLAENVDEDDIALVEEATVEEPITEIKDLEVESSPTSEGAIVRTEETTETADEIKDVEDEDTSDLEEEDE